MRFWLTTIIGDMILFMIVVCLLPLLLYHPFPPPSPPTPFFFLDGFRNWFIVHVTGAFNTQTYLQFSVTVKVIRVTQQPIIQPFFSELQVKVTVTGASAPWC